MTDPGAGIDAARRGLRLTTWTSFAVLAVFLVVIATLYTLTVDDEPSGSVLLYGAGILAGTVSVFVRWSTRQAVAEGRVDEEPPDDETPTPLYIAAGMALTGIGFIVGPFIFVPGAVVLVIAILLSVGERR